MEVANQAAGLLVFSAGYISGGMQLGAFTRSMAIEYYTNTALELGVSTTQDSAIFYSGFGNRDIAMNYAKLTNKYTIDLTEGGRWLNSKELYRGWGKSLIGNDGADMEWKAMSTQYADNASGTVLAFIKGASSNRVYMTIERNALKLNGDVTSIIELTNY